MDHLHPAHSQVFWSTDQQNQSYYYSSRLNLSRLSLWSSETPSRMDFHVSDKSFDAIGVIKTVTASISEVFFLCLVGYILSVKGVIDSKSKSTLNKINVSFFTPALMFSKVAFSLTSEKLADLYVVPISFVVITAVSLAIGWLLARLFRLGRAETNFCLSFSMFMNSNSLPIALMTSLISTIHGRSGLSWGADDSKDKQLGRSLSYLVVFSTLGLIFRWSYGVKLLSASVATESDDESGTEVDGRLGEESVGLLGSPDDAKSPSRSSDRRHSQSSSSTDHDALPKGPPSIQFSSAQSTGSAQPHLSSPSAGSSSSAISFLEPPHRANRSRPEDPVGPKDQRLSPPNDWVDPHSPAPGAPQPPADAGARPLHQHPIFHSFPNVQAYLTQSNASSRTSVGTSYDSNDGSVSSLDEPGEGNRQAAGEQRPRKTKTMRWAHRAVKVWRRTIVRPVLRINQFMTPPLYAAALSLIVVCLPRLQNWLEGIQPLRSALKSAGNVSVPLTLVVLGAYFNTGERSKPKEEDESVASSGPGSAKEELRARQRRSMERRTVLASLLARQILTPLLLVPLLFLVLRLVHTTDGRPESGAKFHEDPCFILVTVLLIGAPPAITLAQMTSANPFVPGTPAHRVQAAQNARFESLVSKTLFVAYAVLTPPTTIALVVAGLLVEANR